MASAKKTVLALLVAVLAIGLLSIAVVPARAASDSISLFGSSTAGWGTSSSTETNPGPTLTVAQGDSVTISLTSTDSATHQFYIDLNHNGQFDMGEPESSLFNTTTSFTFTASQAGTFFYYCLIHPTIMKGSFVVQGSGSSPAPSGSDNTVLYVGIVGGLVAVVAVAAVVMRGRKPKA